MARQKCLLHTWQKYAKLELSLASTGRGNNTHVYLGNFPSPGK